MPDRMSSAHALALAIRRGAGAAAAAPTSIPGIAREGNTQSQPRNLGGRGGVREWFVHQQHGYEIDELEQLSEKHTCTTCACPTHPTPTLTQSIPNTTLNIGLG